MIEKITERFYFNKEEKEDQPSSIPHLEDYFDFDYVDYRETRMEKILD